MLGVCGRACGGLLAVLAVMAPFGLEVVEACPATDPERSATQKAEGASMRKLASTSGIAMLLCVLGCSLLFFPWASVDVMYVHPTPQPDGKYKAKFRSSESISGYKLWQGMGCTAAFFGVLLFLFVTGPLEPIPW
jgi:hypothetical protein